MNERFKSRAKFLKKLQEKYTVVKGRATVGSVATVATVATVGKAGWVTE